MRAFKIWDGTDWVLVTGSDANQELSIHLGDGTDSSQLASQDFLTITNLITVQKILVHYSMTADAGSGVTTNTLRYATSINNGVSYSPYNVLDTLVQTGIGGSRVDPTKLLDISGTVNAIKFNKQHAVTGAGTTLSSCIVLKAEVN